jgi:hypothetical protein
VAQKIQQILLCHSRKKRVLLLNCCFLFGCFYFSFIFKDEHKIVYLGKTTPTYESNCRELIKIADDFLSQSGESNDRLTENFVNGNKFSFEINESIKILRFSFQRNYSNTGYYANL